jgi:hypothetical protein
MQLTTLVEMLEHDIPGIADGPSTRRKVAQLYAEQARREAAASVVRDAASEATAKPTRRRRPR